MDHAIAQTMRSGWEGWHLSVRSRNLDCRAGLEGGCAVSALDLPIFLIEGEGLRTDPAPHRGALFALSFARISARPDTLLRYGGDRI